MNKVYFSSETMDWEKWDTSGGVLQVFIYPKNIFSITGWKMAFMFMKDFSCGFLTNKES
jgi:hypothetical protein